MLWSCDPRQSIHFIQTNIDPRTRPNAADRSSSSLCRHSSRFLRKGIIRTTTVIKPMASFHVVQNIRERNKIVLINSRVSYDIPSETPAPPSRTQNPQSIRRTRIHFRFRRPQPPQTLLTRTNTCRLSPSCPTSSRLSKRYPPIFGSTWPQTIQ